MCLMDSLILTLISAVICLAFPKILSMILAAKTKRTAPLPTAIAPQEITKEVPSYPFKAIQHS